MLKKLGPIANIEFDKLFLAQILSHFADAICEFTFVAILIQNLPNPGKAVSITFLALILPKFFFSPFAGSVCDKFSRKKIIFLSTIYRAIILSILTFLFFTKPEVNPVAIYLTTFLLGCGSTFFYPAKMAVIPNIVSPSQLKFANAISSSLGAITILFGAFFANKIIEAYDVLTSMYIVIGAYFISSLFSFILKVKPTVIQDIHSNILKDIKIAAIYLKQHKKEQYSI